MPYRLLSLAVLASLLVLGTPSTARAEEVPSAERIEPDNAEPGLIKPEVVGRLMLSSDEAERARGIALLEARLETGGDDLPAFLDAMARSQARWANDQARLVERWIEVARAGTPTEQDRARRLLAASGEKAVRRLLDALRTSAPASQESQASQAGQAGVPAPPSAATPPVTEAVPSQAVPLEAVPLAGVANEPVPSAPVTREPAAEKETRLDWPVATEVLLVPRGELARWVEGRDEALAPVLAGQAVVVADPEGGSLARSLTGLPDARVLDTRFGESAVRVSTAWLLESGTLRYRRDLARTGKGGWAVSTDTLPRGLQVELHVLETEQADRLRFAIEARNVEVPTPLPAIRLRPAPNVEPVELDVPEWRVTSMRTEADVNRRDTSAALLALFPELVEGHVVAVAVRVVPLVPVAASGDAVR